MRVAVLKNSRLEEYDFEFDSRRPRGNRIVELLTDQGEEIIPDKYYTIALDTYLAKGRDGFDAILDPSVKHFDHLTNLPIL